MNAHITTYRLESVIENSGTIILPDEMKPLHRHRVRLVLTDLDTIPRNPVRYFQEVTRSYNEIADEPDLDIAEIYKEREQSRDRGTVFA
jgi:hypothetical protein